MQKLIWYILGLLLGVEAVAAQPYLKIQKINPDNFPYINLEISVSNIAPIENLNETNFSVFENGWKAGFFRLKKTEPEKNPKNIVLLVDSSMSLSKVAFVSQIQAAAMLVNSIYKNDEVSVMSFHDKPEIKCGFTNSREQLTNCLNEIRQNGKNTVLYDSIYKAMQLLNEKNGSRNFIVLFTDGKEEKSGITLEELINYRNKNPVFIVGTGENSNFKNLARFSHITGGEIYNSANLKNINKIYSLLQVLMDNTYQLEYISHGKENSIDNHVELRFEYNGIRDQDEGMFQIPEKKVWAVVPGVLKDDRFIFFIIISFILLVIIVIAGANSGKNKKVVQIKPEADEIKNTGYRVEEKKKSKNSTEVTNKEFQKARAFIVQKEGPLTGHTHQIRFETTTIGHGNENSVVIDDPTVSYTHAKIVEKENNFYIYDMLSELGVFVNGKKILKPKLLNDFDELKIGRTLLLFRKAYK
jgi:VWFA-related protein